MKTKLGIDKKTVFYYIKIFNYTTLNYRSRVILASTFPHDKIFLEALLF